ncbi:MAG: alpha/beta hydrolase, partial [Bacilli bacterium]|nr:alpha/beta hydrolase [Bacilli bacterium]
MKIGKLAVNFLKIKLTIEKKNTLKKETYHTYDTLLNVPVLSDGLPEHQIDVYHAPKEKKKNACVIYVHGGAYVFSNRKQYKKYAEEFLEYGYDVITVDYRLNDGKRNIKDILFDAFSALNYIESHKKELGIAGEKLILHGDSAGGHICLFSSLINHHPEISK